MNKQAPARKINFATLGRVIKKLFGYYPVLVPLTVGCILFAAIVSSIPSLFIQNVIAGIEKWYLTGDWASAQREIIPYIAILAGLYILSLAATTTQTQLMAYITQGFLDKLRCEMFDGMQDLPIRYFDTHKHGDIMSHYTHDIDTLRQLVSQALPSLIQCGCVVITVFCCMLYFSIWMTLLLCLGVVAMIFVSKKVGGGSAKYFVRNQKSIGLTEGYVQEMMNGQKVIKVFNHEDKSIEEFDKINEALYEDAYRAHAYANMLGPIIANIGNVLYVSLALFGGLLLLLEVPNLSLSGKALSISIVVPFLNMAKQFTGNVNQLSQQFNAIIMGCAGAERVFSLMDEAPEADDGYVTLVNAKIAKDGTITETAERTGHWAWKHPHGDGTTTYTELKGDVRLTEVDFAYEEGKTTMFPFTHIPVRRWRSSVQPVRARPPSPTSSTASTTSRTAKSATTASTSTRSKRTTCAAPSASYFRKRTSSPARSWTTSATDALTQPTKNALRRRNWQVRTTSSRVFRAGMQPS